MSLKGSGNEKGPSPMPTETRRLREWRTWAAPRPDETSSPIMRRCWRLEAPLELALAIAGANLFMTYSIICFFVY
ncbi:hypothetical protein QQZ08_005183 [Neonectria magnoliae]|uniref:Uncharacterized protein n=1 Tax=Neonectria magnoliae TaxID=2732573 RepID=A0ABR1I4J7_9HYPO